jgi:hypothetical protein
MNFFTQFNLLKKSHMKKVLAAVCMLLMFAGCSKSPSPITPSSSDPVISAGGATTFNQGLGVVLSSTSTSGNQWYNNGVAISGATGATYTATTSGDYTVKTTQTSFTAAASNSITVTVNAVAIAALKVAGSSLTDHSGNPVILAGVNVAVYQTGSYNDLTDVETAIKTHTKANCVRLIWESTAAVAALHAHTPAFNPTQYTNQNLDAALALYTTDHILPILSLNDITDLAANSLVEQNDVAGSFTKYVTKFWTDPAIITILKNYQGNLVINLQNEWGYTFEGSTYPFPFSTTNFLNAYAGLITTLRTNGITCPIMIDAPDGGTNFDFMINNGAALINSDPLKNILLSVHTYWSTQPSGGIINCPADYLSFVDALANSNLPFVLGEVSDWAVNANNGNEQSVTAPFTTFACPLPGSKNQYAIDYDDILKEAVVKHVGYCAWTWYQEDQGIRNLYDPVTGLTQNTATVAYTFPADILSSSKTYGLNNTTIVKIF